MFSESDEDEEYTVHEVLNNQEIAPQLEVTPQLQQQQQQLEDTGKAKVDNNSAPNPAPLARYYRLGTQQRHAFDEHMRRLREEAQRFEREREFRQQHPFRPLRETAAASSSARASAEENDKALLAQEGGSQQGQTTAEPNKETVNTTAAPVKPVFDRLAAQAVQLELRRRHREEQKRRAEAAALREAFQPTINHRTPVYGTSLRHLDDVPVEERLLHYGETVARERQRRQELKAIEEKAAVEAAISGSRGVGNSFQQMSSEERRQLQEDFQKRNERFLVAKAQHRVQAEQRAADEFSFQPQISATSAALDEVRRKELVQARKAELLELLGHSAEGASLTVSQHSSVEGCGASRRSNMLYEQAVTRQRQQSQSSSQQQRATSSTRDKRQSPMTNSSTNNSNNPTVSDADKKLHQPQTNPTSDKWIASGPHRHFFEHDFVRRQELYERVKEEEAGLKAAANQTCAASQVFTGGVKLTGNNVANLSAESSRKVNTEELNERLYYSARKASEVAQRRREASLNAHECPFRPKLSPGTQYVLRHMRQMRDGDVVKRLTAAAPLTSPRRKNGSNTIEIDPEKKDLYEVAPAAQRSKSATVRSSPPSTASPSSGTNSAGPQKEEKTSAQPSVRQRMVITRDQAENFYQRQMSFLQERQDLIHERKEGEAMQELVECTFRPRTNTDRREGSSVPRATNAAVMNDEGQTLSHVTGVSGFLERQVLARQRKAEHDELVRTMGLPRNKAAPSVNLTTGTTLTNPFTLQTAQRRRRSSCSPSDHAQQRSTVLPGEAGKNGAAVSPIWMSGLTSSERLLYDALAASEQYPATATTTTSVKGVAPATAPLFPLPGYTRSEDGDEAIYFDELEGCFAGTGAVDNSLHEDTNKAYMPRPSQSHVQPPRREVYRDKASLFSSLSRNAYTGRSLGPPAAGVAYGGLQNQQMGERHGMPRPRLFEKPSALKGVAAAERASSAQRRKQRRTVSFAVEDGASSPQTGRKTASITSHADPMQCTSH